MSIDDLLDAYQLGSIGRRAFVRGLVDRGVSLRAAAIHAVALRSMNGVSRVNVVEVVDGFVDDFDNDVDEWDACSR